MSSINKTITVLMAAVMLGAGATHAELEFSAVVSNVTMTQRDNSRIVDIEYTLAGEDAIITLTIETNNVVLPDSAVMRLSGDVCKMVQTGSCSIVWNAGADWPEHMTESARARVTAWSTSAPPLYCAVDVVGGTAAETYPVYYYASVAAVPEGVTNDIYKTTRILMRKLLPTGAIVFQMGSPTSEDYRYDNEDQHDVALTKAFYAGVYEITQSQWYQVMGTWPSFWYHNDYKLTRPVESVSYNYIRGSSAGAGWPANGDVDNSSFVGQLRVKTGLTSFDLPTEAQWEYACRAGKTGALNDGTENLVSAHPDAQMDALGRYWYNGGKINGTTNPEQDCTTANATAPVGSYAPNMWGLYDMHGNVYEWCLDWYVDNLGSTAVENPKGTSSGSERVRRGGAWNSAAVQCRSAFRSKSEPLHRDNYIGFRIVRTLP